jgi:hypothetical protein
VNPGQVVGRSAWGAIALMICCAACGGSAAGTGDYQLIAAQHTDCQQPGQDVAHYLDTGDPTSYDPNWGTQRQQLLSLSGDSRALYIRQQADAVIQTCDANESAQEAAAAQAQQQAQASASAAAQAQADAAARAAWVAKVSATCARVGGAWDGVCHIAYRSPDDGSVYQYTVSFDSSGNITPSGPQNATECSTYFGSGVKGYWHPDTDICAI